MSDTRVDLVNSLITNTEFGKLKWEIGARRDQYFAILPSGSVVVSKLNAAYLEWIPEIANNVPRSYSGGAITLSEVQREDISGAYSGGAPLYNEVAKSNTSFDDIYALEIRDKSANVIDTITSELWKSLPNVSSENGIEKLYKLAQKNVRDTRDQQLGKLLNDLNAL